MPQEMVGLNSRASLRCIGDGQLGAPLLLALTRDRIQAPAHALLELTARLGSSSRPRSA